MNSLRNIAFVLLAMLVTIAAGCSGSNADNATPGNGEWDTMKWDQDNWS